jgi:hypothetical protein
MIGSLGFNVVLEQSAQPFAPKPRQFPKTLIIYHFTSEIGIFRGIIIMFSIKNMQPPQGNPQLDFCCFPYL